MDKKDRLRSIDYITISYCKFTNQYWTVAYGTQNTEITRDRTTLLYNWWNKNVRRCPQLGNGIMHVYNNYYEAYGDSDNNRVRTKNALFSKQRVHCFHKGTMSRK